jgi:diguanylate cyclase (GGDEF)-like protein
VQRKLLGNEVEHPLDFTGVSPALGNAVRAYRLPMGQSIDPTSHWETTFAVAEAMGDYLVFGESDPDCASPWQARLAEQYESYHRMNPAAEEDLQSLIDSVQNRLQEFPPQAEPLPSREALLGQANRELGRWAWRSRRALRKAKRKIRSLKRDALRDPLTGLYNRRFLWEALHKELARCVRHQAPVGLLFVDVDGFKALNDTFGHPAGDRVLVRIAEALLATLRQADILARYGGEEFVILPLGPSESGIVRLAERLRSAVEKLEIQPEGRLIRVTISVGCTLTIPDGNDQGERLLAAADAAMYDAKRLGGNRIAFRPLLNES